jgi:hypothetical protein
MDDDQHEARRWESCCFAIDADACRYCTQVTFGAVLVILSMIQLVREADNQSLWMSTLSATIATFLPHPEIRKKIKSVSRLLSGTLGLFLPHPTIQDH